MGKLPKIYQNSINKKFNNNKIVSYVKDEIINNNSSVSDILDNIFNGIGHSYNIRVIINTRSKEYDTSIIYRTNDSIVTIDNDVINISEIKSIVIK